MILKLSSMGEVDNAYHANSTKCYFPFFLINITIFENIEKLLHYKKMIFLGAFIIKYLWTLVILNNISIIVKDSSIIVNNSWIVVKTILTF